MLRKVVSGGQTGADVAGLRAARTFFLETGGWVPKGFKTENGPRPGYADEFGLVETETEDYVERTLLNARDSDGTIRIATKMNSVGEKCTLKGIKMFKRPYFDVDPTELHPAEPTEVADWIVEEGIGTLNVAGNRESVSPGIERFAEKYLCEVFRLLDERGALEKRDSENV